MILAIAIWLVLGGLAGWIASIVMRTDAQQGILLNVAVGIAGAFLGGLIFHRGAIVPPDGIRPFLVATLGAILLLAIVNLFRRGSIR